MKQKTFEFDDGLAAEFERFCRSRQLVEKRIAAAAVLAFMQAGADEREAMLLALDSYGEEQPTRPRLAASPAKKPHAARPKKRHAAPPKDDKPRKS